MEMADALDMELLYLPGYSPNLNLIKRVWRLVKARCLRNKYFPNFTLFTGALDEFLDSPTRKKPGTSQNTGDREFSDLTESENLTQRSI
jgi:hypothetical protein